MKRISQKIKSVFRKKPTGSTQTTVSGESSSSSVKMVDLGSSQPEGMDVKQTNVSGVIEDGQTEFSSQRVGEVGSPLGDNTDLTNVSELVGDDQGKSTTLEGLEKPDNRSDEAVAGASSIGIPVVSEEERKRNKNSVLEFQYVENGRKRGKGVFGLVQAVEQKYLQYPRTDHLNEIISEASDRLRDYEWGSESVEQILQSEESKDRKEILSVFDKARMDIQSINDTDIGLRAEHSNFRF